MTWGLRRSGEDWGGIYLVIKEILTNLKELIQYMLFDSNVIKLEVNNRKKNQENLQTLNIYIRKKLKSII